MTAMNLDVFPCQIQSRQWTEQEDEFLRKKYHRLGAREAGRHLGVSTQQACRRAKRLGLARKVRWTAEDDRRIQMLWGEKTVRSIAARLNRTPAAISLRAYRLGLRGGAPDGMESMKAASRRTGFHATTLREILSAFRVAMRVPMSISGVRSPRRVVDVDDVNDAVGAWLKMEVVNNAAARHGLSFVRLSGWLEASGREMPARPRGNRRWRVPTETIDAVVAERRELETLKAAAERHGIGMMRLRRLLRAAGVVGLGPRKRLGLLKTADVDRALVGIKKRTLLNRDQVIELRASGDSPAVLAARYRLSVGQVRLILLRKAWKDVTE